ncbi:response regulator [Phenylobacterium sp.]|uniref:response regulator n=1 Tax=Phenylobacterium sp. TaxID=1871053 RepID=UPI002E347E60|nr:response regulator [Phenylobacterium sp.]HEX3367483.1 response regulator [Phenylobacterium sp.]
MAPPQAVGGARDLYELLAVIIGVCESLAENLKGAPQHAELARVGLLAADRAAGLLAGLALDGAAMGDGADPSDASPADDPSPQGQVRTRKVLLVEDDPDLLLLLTAAFVREGFQTYCARNGRQGVDLLQTLKPDLMITDIVMPEMEGIGTIMEARRVAPDTKVIAISGGGHYGRSQNFLVWAHELGADEVLAKPFRMSSLITAARVVLDRPPAGPPDDETDFPANPGIALSR